MIPPVSSESPPLGLTCEEAQGGLLCGAAGGPYNDAGQARPVDEGGRGLLGLGREGRAGTRSGQQFVPRMGSSHMSNEDAAGVPSRILVVDDNDQGRELL